MARQKSLEVRFGNWGQFLGKLLRKDFRRRLGKRDFGLAGRLRFQGNQLGLNIRKLQW